MRLPWVQVTEEVMGQTAPDLAVMLDWSEAQSGWGLLCLFRWALGRAPDNLPPSHSDVISGAFAARLIARAAGWAGDPEEFVDACCQLAKPVLERVDGGIRIRGLDRYDAAWGKSHPEEWKRIRSGASTSPEPSRPEHVPNPARNRSEPGTEPTPKTKTQTQRTTPPVGPPGGAPVERAPAPDLSALAPGDSLRDGLEAAWLAVKGAAYAWDLRRDDGAVRVLLRYTADVREILRRWEIGLARSRYPQALTVADLAKHWNAYAAPEQPAGAAPPSRPRASDGAGSPQPSRPCDVCREPVERGDTWGQWLCGPDSMACVDAMGTEPSAAAAARWVQGEKGGSR